MHGVIHSHGGGSDPVVTTRDADGKIIHEQSGAIITKTTPAAESLREPSLVELAVNFKDALSRWASAGFSLVDRPLFDARLRACRACPHWDEKARLGAGKCNHPKCGCTKAKLWLATERCPDSPPRWPSG